MRVGYTMLLFFAVVGCAQVSGFDDLKFEDLVDVTFCNSLGTQDADVELTLELGRGHDRTLLRAFTGCCTPCTTINADKALHAVLLDHGMVVSDTTLSLGGDRDYLLMATMNGETPMVGFMDLTKEHLTCDGYQPAGFSACGSADGDADMDADTDTDTDADAGTENPLPCGGFMSENEVCDTCMRTYCCDEAAVCGDNYACVNLNDCLSRCALDDTACSDDCVNLYYGGYSDLYAFDTCLGDSCKTACL